ncbi:MAG: hypothetical protein R2865_10340 [Deinococcales bacterium]
MSADNIAGSIPLGHRLSGDDHGILVFLMRQFFESLPQDLFDAGRIDGG